MFNQIKCFIRVTTIKFKSSVYLGFYSSNTENIVTQKSL